MSRVGKNPISLPDGTQFQLSGQDLSIKGKLGQLQMRLPRQVVVEQADGAVTVKPANDTATARSLWGTTQRNISNMVEGVSTGFTRRLEIQGVGYRAAIQGSELVMQLGYSHEIRFPVPQGITIKCEKPTLLSVEGIDRQLVGQVAANIRNYRKPEPYKGKGIRYEGEYVHRKEGKKK